MSYLFLGTERFVGKPPHYFAERHCTIDYRGEFIIHPDAEFGFEIAVYTVSHPADWLLTPERSTRTVPRGVIVEKNAWVCSRSVLFNCTIGEGAVVAIGTVVMGVDIPPYTMAAGNPAVIIARYTDGKWVQETE